MGRLDILYGFASLADNEAVFDIHDSIALYQAVPMVKFQY